MRHDLFGPLANRRKPRVMMHAIDTEQFPDGKTAGEFQCRKCGHSSGWIYASLADCRRGRPCPECNQEAGQ